MPVQQRLSVLTMWTPMGTDTATTAPITEPAAIIRMPTGTESATTVPIITADTAVIIQIPTETESVTTGTVTAAMEMAADTMAADTMEDITGKKNKGDTLCVANRRSNRQ